MNSEVRDKFTRANVGVVARLGMLINPDGINTGNLLQFTTCPVSLQMLNDLHWKQGKSLKEMAEYCSVVAGRTIKAGTVHGWMNRAKLQTRSLSESHKLAFKKFPHLKRIVSQNLAHSRKRGQPIEFLIPMQRKARRAAIKAKRARWVSRKCDNPECKEVVCRRPCEMRKQFVYHSLSCAATHLHIRRKQEQLRKEAEQVFGKTFS